MTLFNAACSLAAWPMFNLLRNSRWIVLLVCFLAWPVRAEDAAAAGAGPFERHGLVRLGQRVWVLSQEVELREKLAALPKRRERILLEEKELDAAVAGNLRRWQESRPAIAALQQTLSRLNSSDPERPLIERQLAGLVAAARDPVQLGGQADVRERLIALSGERCELLAELAWIRAAPGALRDSYARLAAQPEIAAALQQSDNRQRLGPQRNYRADVERLKEYEELAATRWVPIFQQSGQTRLTALVNERAATTFTWSEASDQLVVLTSSAAEAAGLDVPAAAPSESIAATPERKVTARRITLDRLRLGKCLLRDVEAYVLPPEAEDVGNRLGRMTLINHRVRLAPQQLRMWIDE